MEITVEELTIEGFKAFLIGTTLEVSVDSLIGAEAVVKYVMPFLIKRKVSLLKIQAPVNIIYVSPINQSEVEIRTVSNESKILN